MGNMAREYGSLSSACWLGELGEPVGLLAESQGNLDRVGRQPDWKGNDNREVCMCVGPQRIVDLGYSEEVAAKALELVSRGRS